MRSLKKLFFVSFLAVSVLAPSFINLSFGALESSPVLSEPILSQDIEPKEASPITTPESTLETAETPVGETAPTEPEATSDPAPFSETIKPISPEVAKSDLNAVSKSIAQISNKTGSISNLESSFSKVQNNFLSLRKNLTDKNLSAETLSRFDNFQSQYETQVADIITKLRNGDDAEAEIKKFLAQPEVEIENPAPFRATEFKGEIKKASVSDFPKTNLQTEGDLIKNLITSAVLKTRSILDVDNNEVSNPEPEIDLASNAQLQTSNALNPADLEESEEIKFTQNIKNLAVSLGNDPLTIFNYVANSIDYVPYYGSKKGADSTLLEKLGNDFDQSSLLIGLLRVGDANGQNKIPSRYKQATIKLSVGEVMDLLGVEDPIVAATIFEKTDVPYILYVDQNQTPLFFVLEITYVEAYIDYDYTRGVIQGNPGAQKRWVPLIPFLAKFYKSQHIDALEDMNFNAETFYDSYLQGNYGNQEPIDALKGDIEDYLASTDPDLSLEDAYVQTYRSEEDSEFLPLTPPFEVVSSLSSFNVAPDNLKHRIEFQVLGESEQEILNYSASVSTLANQEITLDYNPATPEDGIVINSFPTIYDVVPLSLVNVRPVIKINGNVVGIDLGNFSQLGQQNKLKIIFKSPKKDIGGSTTNKIIDTIEKINISGNAESIALNTDFIAPPEIRPSVDTETTSAVANQKLWKTAQNFLYRLQVSHDELARLTGGRFTNAATRAIVFNGLDVEYQGGSPYAFNWKGLRIDASSVVNYYSHFSPNPERHQKEFMYLFGLQASLDEADIFENDFGVESISTTKGLKLINENQVPGVIVKKITSANKNEIDSLTISESTKNKLRDAVNSGNIVYVPNSDFTYESWNGLVYIDIDPDTGFGSYIIGEGLNGGYTATPIEQWPSGIVNFLIYNGLNNLSVAIISPASGQQFTKGQKVPWQATYTGNVVVVGTPISWTENQELDSSAWPVGNVTIPSGYGTNASVAVILKYPARLGTQYNQYDSVIIKYANQYGIPSDLLKSIIHQEALKTTDEQSGQRIFDARSYRYEAHKDYDWYSRQNPSIPSYSGWRGLGSYPEKHFAIGGHVLTGELVPHGNQVPPGYIYWSEHTAAGKLDTLDTNNDGNLTAAELVLNNPRQGWRNRPSWNFTAQLVLSASYGLGQTMYETAVNRGFDNRASTAQFATPINKLFEPEVSIKLMASYLSSKYSGNWSDAVFEYNGGYDDPDPTIYDSVKYANEVINRWNNGEGIYKPIN